MGKPSKDIFPYATVPRLWPGGTVVCIASGPSLTVEDVNYVRGKADGVIVVNTSYQIAPWADCLCASDLKWWHWHKGVPSFKGLKYATSRHCARYPGVSVLRNAGRDGLDLRPDSVRHGLNTGYRAINVAVHFGAKRIILLGYDMQLGPNKKEHWHKDHPSKGPSPYSAFIKYFASMVEPLEKLGVEVINCSRQTALPHFPKRALRETLCESEAFHDSELETRENINQGAVRPDGVGALISRDVIHDKGEVASLGFGNLEGQGIDAVDALTNPIGHNVGIEDREVVAVERRSFGGQGRDAVDARVTPVGHAGIIA